ncbi:type II secretion system protein GspF [bacterium]|nr:type II secretion system protein GspF [bacterium]
MARYFYVAVDVDGRRRDGGIDADTETSARAALVARKLLPVEISVAETSAASSSSRVAANGRVWLRHKDRLLVTRQLATLVDASVSVDEALGLVIAQQDKPAVRQVLGSVRAGVQEGRRLADAMGAQARSFPPLYRAAVSGGERVGRLGFVLTRLADHLTRENAIRSKITTALIYPAALMLVATTVVISMMTFVVPGLAEQFETFDTKLPLLTTILIGTSSFLSGNWGAILVFLALLTAGCILALRLEPVRVAVDGLLLKTPGLGRWVRAINASRLARSVGTLTLCGLPVLDSLRTANSATSNRVFARAMDRAAERVEQGEPLSAAWRASAMTPPLIVYMAASGETSGELPRMLEKAAEHVDQEFEAFTQMALSLVEPAIIVLMGAVVTGIVLAIMLPILQLNQLVAG